MQVANAQTLLEQIFAEVFGHLLGERRDKNSVAALNAIVHHFYEVVNLTLRWLHNDLGVNQPSWSNNLLNNALRLGKFELARSCRHENTLMQSLHHLFESQWTVIDGRRQTKAMFYKIRFATQVAGKLPMQLRNCNVAFINDQQIVFWEIVEQGERWLPWLAAINVH
ncbi:unannotated protein [freshwater metagenome]|uniref:Unannotated protein n=1 Tax=freshwater metagenome TaxID=449393 RepID=A0A6J7QXY7_9ZZZZ